MITNILIIVIGVVCFVLGRVWDPVWALIKAKIWPGSVPVTPEQVAATKPPPTP